MFGQVRIPQENASETAWSAFRKPELARELRGRRMASHAPVPLRAPVRDPAHRPDARSASPGRLDAVRLEGPELTLVTRRGRADPWDRRIRGVPALDGLAARDPGDPGRPREAADDGRLLLRRGSAGRHRVESSRRGRRTDRELARARRDGGSAGAHLRDVLGPHRDSARTRGLRDALEGSRGVDAPSDRAVRGHLLRDLRRGARADRRPAHPLGGAVLDDAPLRRAEPPPHRDLDV